MLPLLVVLSLVAHIAVVAPSLFNVDSSRPKSQEIPVELVQLPPEPPKAPQPKKAAAPSKPAEAHKAPAQPPPGKAEPIKPSSPTSAQAKPAPAKPPLPKPPPPKPPPPEPEAKKPAAAKPPTPKVEQGKPRSAVPAKELNPSGSDRYKSLIGAMPALALPGTSDQGTDEVSYSQLVLSHVAKAKKEGRFRGMPGSTSVGFTIDDHGGLASVEIVRPSGIPDLDAEAIAMIRRGAPYPPPPPGGRRDYTITLRFQPLI